jgi:hypothetical protein
MPKNISKTGFLPVESFVSNSIKKNGCYYLQIDLSKRLFDTCTKRALDVTQFAIASALYSIFIGIKFKMPKNGFARLICQKKNSITQKSILCEIFLFDYNISGIK